MKYDGHKFGKHLDLFSAKIAKKFGLK